MLWTVGKLILWQLSAWKNTWYYKHYHPVPLGQSLGITYVNPWLSLISGAWTCNTPYKCLRQHAIVQSMSPWSWFPGPRPSRAFSTIQHPRVSVGNPFSTIQHFNSPSLYNGFISSFEASCDTHCFIVFVWWSRDTFVIDTFPACDSYRHGMWSILACIILLCVFET